MATDKNRRRDAGNARILQRRPSGFIFPCMSKASPERDPATGKIPARTKAAGLAVRKSAWLAKQELAVDARFNLIKNGLPVPLPAKTAKVGSDVRAYPQKLNELGEIVHRIADWAGGDEAALSWCRAQPIAAFGGRTAEQLVKSGEAGAVRDYLDHLALGGFA